MDFNEALETIMSAVPNLEDLTEAFDAIRTAGETQQTGTPESDKALAELQGKYDKLKSEYVKRFNDSMGLTETGKEEPEPEKPTSVSELDFDASTES